MQNGKYTVHNYRKFLYFTIIHCLLGSRNKGLTLIGASLFCYSFCLNKIKRRRKVLLYLYAVFIVLSFGIFSWLFLLSNFKNQIFSMLSF